MNLQDEKLGMFTSCLYICTLKPRLRTSTERNQVFVSGY